MDNACFFSVIVPVYRVELYIKKCIESVLNQSFTDYELILVDDGSPDHCPQICDEYAQKDERIRVIHKANGGLSSARNAGMLAAKGRFITFLDSDDFWINDSVLESVYKTINAKNAEIVVIKEVNYYQNSGTFGENYNLYSSEQLEDNDYEQNLQKLISSNTYRANAWNKVFLRELLNRRDLLFTEGIIAEDIDWAARLCLAANSIALLDKPVYGYRIGRPGAITSSLTIKNLIDTRDSMFRCIQYISGRNNSENFLYAYYSYVAYRYIIWMAEYYVVKDSGKYALCNEMKNYAWLLKYDGIRRVKIARYLYQIFGFNGTSMLLGLYLHGRRVRKKKHGNLNHIYSGV